MKRITIFGSTGSIGRNSLDVIARFPDKFCVQYLTANNNVELLAEQALQFRPRAVAITNPALEPVLRERLHGEPIEVMAGPEALCDIARRSDSDFVIGALVGFSGLKPTVEALKCGKCIGLANKETLVVAGEIITKLLREYGGTLLPIDSEHSAIFQCLVGEPPESISKIILTASGGPFRTLPKEEFHRITLEQALRHPNWKMGRKITIDSATLMNKGLEVIEAKWLFGVPLEKIEVVVHPQSIIHSMVEFADGSIKAQLGTPDMRIPIQYALTYPERFPADYPRIDWHTLARLDFEAPDKEKFRCLALAYQAIEQGASYPTVLNAANEAAVALFLEEKIPFVRIPELIEEALNAHQNGQSLSLDDLIEIDRETRRQTFERAGVSALSL
ncbi:MAG: 1-deoxy-D-xylulose-5-phosphate reductoisomerase [Chloroherpetonaceae bacterium]|nr:1-deoxy-D-xylulose-5-phosphate reductoisomerase [Chloroherpetonaceae bacterium]MCS7212505.1 1-deoxy-D-xylulose-5-phosphate reductoisomerase [Chloroherpetonaceae bacterium]MDW8020623.1 1-deoxy-D-xylulose-5-phosphate reductoisomerase [Chloroherpetonaceae bacterium]MDW8465004.1 1-deoxy-D-xylulose-5-phosphate reductoisomerase [Chloroherpetonaceae bacterium]